MQQTQEPDADTHPKWFNSPVSFHEGTLTDLRQHIPVFERRSFGLTQHGNERSRLNERLDTIVRLPYREDQTFIPVGVVSKDYALVQHNTVLDIATKALNAVKIAPGDVRAELTISEYGVYKGTAKNKGKLIASRTEEDVYKAVGLPFIAPELREDRGEIEAAQRGELPALIGESDLRSDLHMHSLVSDGTASIEEMARAGKERGFTYIAMTDHASPMGMVKGIKDTHRSLEQYLSKISDARRKVPDIHILAGSEVDILKDGSLYLPDELLKELDFVIASIHQNFHDSPEANTKRLIRACENPYVHALGHPTTRLLGKRMGIEFDVEAVLKAAKENDVWIELNASHERLDLPDVHLKRAKELGLKILIGSDAHSTKGLDYGFGMMQARRGWLEKKDVVNCLPWKEFERILRKPDSRASNM